MYAGCSDAEEVVGVACGNGDEVANTHNCDERCGMGVVAIVVKPTMKRTE